MPTHGPGTPVTGHKRWPHGGYQIPALIQQTSAAVSGTTGTATLGSNVGAGNGLVLCGQTFNTFANDIASVSGGGVTWLPAAASGFAFTTGFADIWYGFNSTGGAGTTVITITYSGAGAAGISGVIVSEWSHLLSLDAAAAVIGSGTSITTPSETPNQAAELVVAMCNVGSAGVSAPSVGYTAFAASGGYFGAAYQINTTPGTPTACTWTCNSTNPAAAIATFKHP